jgi:hypothetical protein
MNTAVPLRNGEQARITGSVQLGEFRLKGLRSNGSFDLWRLDGSWREDGTEHPLDLLITKDQAKQLSALRPSE